VRLLLIVIELAAIAAVLGVAIWVFLRLRQRELRRGRWTVAVRSLGEGDAEQDSVAVELRRPGHRPQRVALIPSHLSSDEFADSLAAAQSDAEMKAAALNAAEPVSRATR
jgi:hypothetical protein